MPSSSITISFSVFAESGIPPARCLRAYEARGRSGRLSAEYVSSHVAFTPHAHQGFPLARITPGTFA